MSSEPIPMDPVYRKGVGDVLRAHPYGSTMPEGGWGCPQNPSLELDTGKCHTIVYFTMVEDEQS